MGVWNSFQREAQIEVVTRASHQRPQLIFKHSTRCGISFHVKEMLFAATDQLSDRADLHFLDLIADRPVSNQTASELGVPHQSPQVILLRNGKVVYHSSHFSISPQEILAAVA